MIGCHSVWQPIFHDLRANGSLDFDDSWLATMHLAWLDRWQFSTDLIFTAGPSSFIWGRMYHPETFTSHSVNEIARLKEEVERLTVELEIQKGHFNAAIEEGVRRTVEGDEARKTLREAAGLMEAPWPHRQAFLDAHPELRVKP